MATFKLKIFVDELDNVLTLADTIRIYRSTTGDEIDRVLYDTIPLVVDQAYYEYDDTSGATGYVAWTTYYHSSTTFESGFSQPIEYGVADVWYCSVQDLRDEGVTVAEASDERITAGIQRAQQYIEHVTGRWFYPKNVILRIDGSGNKIQPVPVPIIQIDAVSVLLELVDTQPPTTTDLGLESIRVYNRHLTKRMITSTDDRESPLIVLDQYDPAFLARFPNGYQNILLDGWFGYTELLPTDPVGETIEGSQIPLSKGRTPVMINDVAKRLTLRFLPELSDSDSQEDLTKNPYITRIKTRDQEIQYGGGGGIGAGASQFTGDSAIDQTLAMFSSPMATGMF